MIRLGAYQKGSDPATDEAIFYRDKLESFLSQTKDEQTDVETGYKMLAEIFDGETT